MTEMNLKFDADGNMSHEFRCGGQSYWIDEDNCDRRQADGRFKQCKRCTYRHGGKNDPRPQAKQTGSQGKEKQCHNTK